MTKGNKKEPKEKELKDLVFQWLQSVSGQTSIKHSDSQSKATIDEFAQKRIIDLDMLKTPISL